MKRFLSVIALCVMTFWGSHTLRASDFGVVAGANFTSLGDVSARVSTGYHVGIGRKFNLPFGFSVKPTVLYNLKASVVESAIATNSDIALNVGYAEFMGSIQWGPDLILFRPFFDVSPFIGYAVNNDFETTTLITNAIKTWKNEWDGMNRLEYGFGLGLGVEVWKLQVVGRYNWNLGSLYSPEGEVDELKDIFTNAKASVLEDKNFNGVTLSVSLMF